MTTRKRKRQEAFEEQPEPEPVLTEEEAAKAREEKEQEIWDTVREAHYEAIEQLPLTLQRQLSLIRQLDEQASSCVAQILPTLQQYIDLRKRLAGKSLTIEPGEDTMESTSTPAESSSTKSFARSSFTVGKAKAESSRDMAQQIALLAEEIMRASQEKVNIAQANCDSVERHIQLLDQAIKEQEAALSSDPSNPVHIHLPELVIPQWRPKSTITVDANMDQYSEDQEPVDVVGDQPTEKRTSKRKGKDGKKGKQTDESPSLTITLPPAQPSDEPELLYCYCNRVSFGEMIACDNPNCEREWFHYGCVGLLEPPEGEWFCEDCRLRQEDV